MFAMMLSMVAALIISVPSDTLDEKFSPTYSIFGFFGYGMSAFEDEFIHDADQSSYIPGGLQFYYDITPTIRIGAEYKLTLSQFKFEGSPSGAVYYYDYEGSLSSISVLGKIFIFDGAFGRAGFGTYSGSGKQTNYEPDGTVWYIDEIDLDSGIGFNIGAGYLTQLSDQYYGGVEGVYHIVSLEPDDEDNSYDFNHWAIQLFGGITF